MINITKNINEHPLISNLGIEPLSRNFNKDNYISAIDIVNDDFDKKRIENKIILIGSSAQGLFDIVKISNGKIVPGVEAVSYTHLTLPTKA